MDNITHHVRPPLLRRIVAFPLTLLLIEVVVIAVLAGGYTRAAHSLLNKDDDTGYFTGAVGLVVVLVLAWKALQRWLERRDDQEFSLPGAGRELGTGLLLGFAVFSGAVAIVALLGGFEILGLRGQGQFWAMATMAITTGAFEEILFRGVLLRHIEALLGTWAALILTSILFGAAHLANPNASLFAAFAIAMEAGILLGAAYLYTRRLWLAVGLHAGWNFTQGWVFSIPVSGGDAPLGLLITRRVGPDWLTGGDFGLEASVPATLLATVAGLLLLLAARRRAHFTVPLWRRQASLQ